MRIRVLIVVILILAGQAAAQVDSTFVVPKDETLPLDELSLLLDPFTKEDLAREVVLWQGLLQAKLRTISEVQITMKYLNQDIQVFEDVQRGLAAFLAASGTVNTGRAAALGDTTQAKADVLRELDQELLEARFRLSAAVNEAISREAKAYQVHNLYLIVNEARASLESRDEGDEYREFGTADRGLAELTARLRESGVEFNPDDHELMTTVTAEAAEILRQKTGIRDLIVAYLSNLMDDRGELVKRVRLVLSEWEKKGAAPEDVAGIRVFVDDVTSFQLDVADQTTRWSLLELWLKSDAGGLKVAGNIGKFLALMIFFGLLAMLVGLITSKALHRTRNISQLMRDFVIRSIRRVIFLVGFLMSLTLVGVNIGPILGVVGAAGFILAFALQTTLGNFASGIMIMIYKPFDVGDAIDAAGVRGVVKTMNLTSTIINTFDNKLVIVPNNSIWGSVITNINGSETRRVDLVFRISYSDDAELAEKIIHESLAEQDRILAEPEPMVRLHELGDFTVNFICRPWVATVDYWTVRWELTRRIRDRFAAAGFAPPVDPAAFVKRVGGPPAQK